MTTTLFDELDDFAVAFHTFIGQLNALLPSATEVEEAGVGGKITQRWTLDDLIGLVNQGQVMEIGLLSILTKGLREKK